MSNADLALTNQPITWKTLVAISKTEFVPKDLRGRPEAMLAAIKYGEELGIPPMTALQEIDVIDGRPTPSASMLTALVRKAGHRITPVELTDKVATARFERYEDGEKVEEFEFSFTWEMAERVTFNTKQGGKWVKKKLTGKANWRNYPEAMLWWRAVSQGCRIFFPDVITMLKYLGEELGSETWTADIEPPEEMVIEDGEVVEAPDDHVFGDDDDPALEASSSPADPDETDEPDDEPDPKDEATSPDIGDGPDETPADTGSDDEQLDAEQVAAEFDGDIVDDHTDERADKIEAWRHVTARLQVRTAEGTIPTIKKQIRELCAAMEGAGLWPDNSCAKLLSAWYEVDHIGSIPSPEDPTKSGRKSDIQDYARRVHSYAVKTYNDMRSEDPNAQAP